MRQENHNKGQALVMIVLAIVALVGLTGLAIDGGNAYSDRRHAQNAADTGVLAAALAKVNNDPNWKTIGVQRANSNGYSDTDPTNVSSSQTNNVEIYGCEEAAASCVLPVSADKTQYIQMIITSHVRTFFAPVVGIREMVNKVNAIAQAKPLIIAPMWGGNAVVGLDPNGCKAVTYQGNASTTLTGSGIYVNSSCSDAAFFNNSNSPNNDLTAPCLQAVGGITYTPGALDIPADCIETHTPPLTPPILPNISCTGDATIDHPTSSLTPGNWYGAFPPNHVTTLQPGVYCVHQGNFTIQGGQSLIGKGVTIYVIDGFVKWNGGAYLDLEAPSTDEFGTKGLLLYLPPTNSSPVTINGNGSSIMIGSILAPASDVTVEGGGGATGLQTQIVGWHVSLGGSSATTINYDAAKQFQPPQPPTIQLTK